MKLKEIETPISTLSGIGPAKARLFANLGIYTIADLLGYYPKDWEDRTQRVPLSQFRERKVHTIAAVTGHSWFGYGKMRTLKISIADNTGRGELVAFNRPFLEKTLPVGSIIAVTGQFSLRYNQIQSSSFEAEKIADGGSLQDWQDKRVPGSQVLPIYGLTAGLTNSQIRQAIKRALQEYGRGIEDELPAEVMERRGIMGKAKAIAAIHQPRQLSDALEAKRSLIYEELYHFQLAIGGRALLHKGRLPELEPPETQEASFGPEQEAAFLESLSPRQKMLLDTLPFQLTPGQKLCITDMDRDLDHCEESRCKVEVGQQPFTMARLVQGDVGSGKTLAAFFACLRIVDWGGQCALMAPTELLARQHAENAAKMLEPMAVRLAYLTGNIKAANRGPLLNALAAGSIDIVIGTHALFSKNVQYANLHLVIIDEQHRFGVLQRNAILEKGRQKIPEKEVYTVPSLLMLSATPIPRTLALTAFGDLDISIIKSMPAGRLPTKTYLTRMGNETNVYQFVWREIQAGHQAYFVYPLIEEMQEDSTEAIPAEATESGTGGSSGIKSAQDMYHYLSRQVYPGVPMAVIHSRTEEAEQHSILEEFRSGKIQILVATSVVEVGVDVANATCMVIEHADRFGMAALHQLRGRVGRGSLQSHCFLIYGNNLTDTGKERMRVLRETTDGFVIA
ncbi:MAG: ATP-dependent DNA helicase RecG, partial [Spirochaetaceae bacterium]|nr:ATP-dependent DNA helicase RecG [Spirochaetaceae bacterium]